MNHPSLLTLKKIFRMVYEVENGPMFDLVAYVDGGSLGNPGPAGVGVVIEGSQTGRITIGKWIGRQDNNVAEYLALLEALQCAVTMKARKLHVYSDSEVVVRQMTGEYNCRSSRLYSLNWVCRKLARSLNFTISYIRREHNVEANSLAGAAARTTAALTTQNSAFSQHELGA
jgi:ribonuclease HI